MKSTIAKFKNVNMKTLLLLFNMFIALTTMSQNAKLNINYEAFKPISTSLVDNSIGSGFTFILLEKFKKNKVSIIQIHSTNSKTDEILHNLFKENNFDSVFIKLNPGKYCLPIMQCMYNNQELNWLNNSVGDIGYFVKLFIIPDHTIMLNPVVLFSEEEIIN